MRSLLLAAVLVTAAVPAMAEVSQPTAAETSERVASKGMMLRDANNQRLAPISAVKEDGSVGIILASRFVVVPASTLSLVDGKLTTKLTKAELSR
jgi:hypothetical protein